MIILRQKSFSSEGGGKKDNSGKVALGVGASAAALGAGIGAWKGGDEYMGHVFRKELKQGVKDAVEKGVPKDLVETEAKEWMSRAKENWKNTKFKDKWGNKTAVTTGPYAGKGRTVGGMFKKGTMLGVGGGLAAGTALGLGTYAYMKNKNKKE